MKRFLISLLALACMALSSCTEKPQDKTQNTPGTFRFVISSYRMFEQAEYQLRLQTGKMASVGTQVEWTDYDLEKNEFGVTFRCLAPDVASVSATGLVTSLKAGSTTIYADCADKQKVATFKLTVKGANSDSLAVVRAPWNWKAVGTKGAEEGYATFTLFDKVASISIVRYPIASYTTTVFESGGSKAGATSTLASGQGAAFAMNGSYFNTTTLYSNTFLAKDGGVIANSSDSEYNNRSNAILGIFAGRKSLEIKSIDTGKYNQYAKDYADVIASGPLLMSGGKKVQHTKTTDFYTVSHPRSIFGYDKKGYAYMIVIDGRFSGKGEGATVKEETDICSFLGLTDAMNFDGGGSSTLWTTSTGVLNHPCDNSKWDHAGERKVPNIIMVK